MSKQSKQIYAFGPFRFDPQERLLRRDNQPVPLTPKVADTLHVLLQNAGHLVDKDELMRRIWPYAAVGLRDSLPLLYAQLLAHDDHQSFSFLFRLRQPRNNCSKFIEYLLRTLRLTSSLRSAWFHFQ